MKRLITAGLAYTLFAASVPIGAAEFEICNGETGGSLLTNHEAMPLPQREGHRVRTSGRVPHVQIDVDPVPAVNKELHRLAFSLPDVEKRPTIVSLPGTDGMWLSERLPIEHPKAIVAGREFAHIHVDGSLHAPLPYERALELSEAGWGERHPWADKRDGWEGFVLIYTPQTMDELRIVFQLVIESYNHITGKKIRMSNC